MTGANTYTGATTIGLLTTDGGVLRLSGGGTLLGNASVITVGPASDLILDNTLGNLDRLTDQAPITLSGGRLKVIGNGAGNTIETVGVVTLTANQSSTLESDNANLTISGLTRNAGSSLNIVGTAADLGTGNTQINLSGALSTSAIPALSNGILTFATITGPSGLDFATYAPGVNGFGLAALPASAYVTSFAAVPAGTTTANVKLTQSEATTSKTVNALLVAPGVVLTGADALTTTLTIGSGPVILSSGSAIGTAYLTLPGDSVIYARGDSTINSILTGAATSITKAGAAKVTWTAANQYSGITNINEGVLNIQNSAALGNSVGATTISIGAQLQLQGNINVLGETLNANGMGPGTSIYGIGVNNSDGAIYNVSGDNRWAGTVNLGAITGVDAPSLFPNAGFITFTGSGINVSGTGGSLNFTGVLAGAADLIKLGGGQLELSGVLPNTISNGPRIKQGTLFLNKAPGITALNINGATISIGDDVAGSTAMVRLGQDYQIANTNNNIVQVASNGTFDLSGHNQLLTGMTLEIGPLGGATVNIGSGGTLTLNAGINVQTLGSGNPSGATISGGTLALEPFNSSGATFQRTYLVNDGAVGNDLTISSAIVDGTGLRSGGIIKSGFGTLQFSGATSNTYTGVYNRQRRDVLAQ